MRALLVLLTIASVPLGHFVTERPADARDFRAQISDDAAQIPLLAAEPGEAGPLFYRKADGSSSGDGSIAAAGLLLERVSGRSGRFVRGLTGTLPPGPLLPALHLRI